MPFFSFRRNRQEEPEAPEAPASEPETPEIPSYVGKEWDDMTSDEKAQKLIDEAPQRRRELQDALAKLRRTTERARARIS